jgi:hypothetical protein
VNDIGLGESRYGLNAIRDHAVGYEMAPPRRHRLDPARGRPPRPKAAPGDPMNGSGNGDDPLSPFAGVVEQAPQKLGEIACLAGMRWRRNKAGGIGQDDMVA